MCSQHDKENDEEEDVGIDSKIKPEKKIIEPKKESQEDIDRRQAEAYLNFHKK